MASKAKTMDLSVLRDQFDSVQTLTKAIGINHKKIADLTDEMERDKSVLAKFSESMFWKDMGTEESEAGDMVLTQEIPEVFGNHEYDAGKSLRISVNAKVGKRDVGRVDGVDADIALPNLFGDAFPKCFDIDDEMVVTSSPEQLSANFYRRPELFNLTLRDDIKPEVMVEMKRAFPKAFDLLVRDKETYKRVYPDQVEGKQIITTKSGFLEQLGKLPPAILKKAKACIIGLLKENVTFAVNVGNTSKK
jgi:hypothetical protein